MPMLTSGVVVVSVRVTDHSRSLSGCLRIRRASSGAPSGDLLTRRVFLSFGRGARMGQHAVRASAGGVGSGLEQEGGGGGTLGGNLQCVCRVDSSTKECFYWQTKTERAGLVLTGRTVAELGRGCGSAGSGILRYARRGFVRCAWCGSCCIGQRPADPILPL